jgi:hypothetical protein
MNCTVLTGIPLPGFPAGDSPAFCRKHNIAPTQPGLLFVGRIAFEGNIDFKTRSPTITVRSNPVPLLVIAGAGPARGRLGNDVLFAGIRAAPKRRRVAMPCPALPETELCPGFSS